MYLEEVLTLVEVGVVWVGCAVVVLRNDGVWSASSVRGAVGGVGGRAIVGGGRAIGGDVGRGVRWGKWTVVRPVVGTIAGVVTQVSRAAEDGVSGQELTLCAKAGNQKRYV